MTDASLGVIYTILVTCVQESWWKQSNTLKEWWQGKSRRQRAHM